jgi:hypothetical protein
MDSAFLERFGVFKRIVAGFLDSDALELCAGESLEDSEYFYRKVFRGRHDVVEFVERVEIHVIEAIEEICLRERIEGAEVANHACSFVDRARDGDFDNVIVAVPVGVIALAEDGAVLLGGEGIGM